MLENKYDSKIAHTEEEKVCKNIANRNNTPHNLCYIPKR